MGDPAANSRSSSRYSRSVVFPRIKKDRAHERDVGRPSQNGSRSIDDDLEERHSSRRSFKDIHESSNDLRYVLERLEFTEKILEDERRERSLLEDHFRAVMINVQRLSKDMATLQHQVKSEGDNAYSQSIAMKNLELHQVAGIGDVWNRLTLGDLHTIKLSGDLNKVAGEVSDLKRSVEDFHRRLNKLQNVVDGLVVKLEKLSLEVEKNNEVLNLKLETQNQNIEKKIRSVENLYGARQSGNLNQEQTELLHWSEILGNVEQRLETSLVVQKTWQDSFEGKVTKLEENLTTMMQMKTQKEEDVNKRIQELSANQQTAMQKTHRKLKDGYREAFREVYESITTMQTVLEAKLKMTETDLRTSINSIVRTMSHR